MDKEEIKKYRGDVIERFTNIENLINVIISQKYLGKVYDKFLLEFLCDEYCNFGLKRNVLEKILSDFDSNIMEKLRKLSKTRNYFAHCNLQLWQIVEQKEIIIDPHNIDGSINFEDLYKEFLANENDVLRYLLEKAAALGVKISEKRL